MLRALQNKTPKKSEIILFRNLASVANAKHESSEGIPFEEIPGPSKINIIRNFLPGGRFYKKNLTEIQSLFVENYGPIHRVPGLFGRKDIIMTTNPEDIRTVFRTEGIWPIRRGIDVLEHYRKVCRSEMFKHAGGLVAEQGEGWANFRTTVNPVLMQPRTIKQYVPKMDKVLDEFILRIRDIRDPITKEVPGNFEEDLNHWALESVGVVALDTNFGLINHIDKNPDAKRLINSVRSFFQLAYELDVKPSLWKLYPTTNYKNIIKALDTITEICMKYVDEALQRMEKNPNNNAKNENDMSILEKLVKVDKLIAAVMAMDIMLAGVDTTTSALTSCLACLSKFPEKQQKLRDEIIQILPEKDSAMTEQNMNKLPYLRAVIKESLRVFPVVSGNFRTTGQDTVLSGYHIPKATDVAMPSQLLYKDPFYFTDPEEFQPERWLRNESSGCPANNTIDPFILLPFGFGPRMCIGKRLVNLELEIAVSKIIRHFQIEFNYPTDNLFVPNIINTPNIPLKFKFTDLE